MTLKVLVVDDSMIVRKQVAQALDAAGFETCEATDGQDALDQLALTTFELVICDLNMPRMSGIEFLEALRACGDVGTPVVMLTTEVEPDLVSRARSLGARGWIVKPFRPELLVAAVHKLTAAAVAGRTSSADPAARRTA